MTAASTSLHVKQYKPYFSPEEVEKLSAKQRGKLSVSREERARQQACGFLDAVGVRCGFPRKTIATAQTLYMRFHLFFPYQDFNYLEVALSVLYVSSKLHDTLKKPRDIILASYAIRYPNLVKKGVVDPSAVDPNMLEGERKRVLSIERLVLETICFKFGVDVGLDLVVKLGRALGAGKDLCQHAWRMAVDCHRSPAPLSFPPHVIALGSLYTAAILLRETVDPHSPDPAEASDERVRISQELSQSGQWETTYSATWGQVDDVTHSLLDLYSTILAIPVSDPSFLSSPSPVSPKEPGAANSTSSSTSSLNTAFRIPSFWTPQTLTELKIHLRERRPGSGAPLAWMDVDEDARAENASEGLGQNSGTVRFLWESAETPAPVETS